MRRPPAHPQTMAVRCRFEPSRLAPEYLSAAYEQVIPFSRRRRGAAPDAPGAKQPRKEAA